MKYILAVVFLILISLNTKAQQKAVHEEQKILNSNGLPVPQTDVNKKSEKQEKLNDLSKTNTSRELKVYPTPNDKVKKEKSTLLKKDLRSEGVKSNGLNLSR